MFRLSAIVVAASLWTQAAFALETIDLGGRWEVSDDAGKHRIPATVPGCIHTDLLAADRIEDPYFRDNELRLQWIGEQAWTYRREVVIAEEFLKHETVLLCCEGLDTLAEVRLNGTVLGRTDNMFRTWEFKLNGIAKAGANHLEIRFDPVGPHMAKLEKARPLPTWNTPGASYVRKMPCNFGWDWGPTLVTAGIWRKISLIGFDAARWDNVRILQNHGKDGTVGLDITATASPPSLTEVLPARIVLRDPAGTEVAKVETQLATGQAAVSINVPSPQLWWPAGMGGQPLYTLTVELLGKNGKPLDATTKRIGLRVLRALPQCGDRTMRFTANGVPFFAKGANCIPLDMFPSRVTKEQMRRHVADAAAVNMNSLRFWGGGCYEDDALFDACDEYGICVWMDFKFSCATYPSFDPAFLENVRQEARDNVLRLRHHPSIALWCGNNEIMFFRGKDRWEKDKMSEADYYKLFRDTLGEVVRAHAPQSDYVTGSPDCGDVHYWGVWHGGKPFEAYGEIHGFLSEFGFQSWPVPATVNAFTLPADRGSVYSPVMRMHERSGRGWLGSEEDGTVGTNRMFDVLRMYFREPKDFESTLWLSQINQAFGIEYAANLWRREMPRSMGCVFWQYNDIWPGTSWSSVDSLGRWKALHFRARHFYAPVLVSGAPDGKDGSLTLWVTSDRMQPATGELTWRATDTAGAELERGTADLTIQLRESREVRKLALKGLLEKHGAAGIMVWLDLEIDGATVSRNLCLFSPPKDLKLSPPEIRTTLEGKDSRWTVTLDSKRPALWTWLEIDGADAVFSDNFFHLAPGEPREITITLPAPMSADALRAKLRTRSLTDTYSKAP